MKKKKEGKLKKKKLWEHTISSTSNNAESVVNQAINLGIRDVLKIKMKKKNRIRQQKNMKIKTENLTEYATTVG